MKKGFLVAIILIAVLTCAFALVACAEVSTTVTYMVDGEVFETVTVTNAHQSDPGFTPSKSGYTFDGWYTDTALRIPFDFEAYAANEERTNIAVYAKWEVNTYNITYENTLGAENSNPATYNIESATITLADITAPGYTFEGWFVGEEKVESIELGSYGDITLTAKWSIIEYSVNYVLDGGINAAANPFVYTVETLGGADGVIPLEDPSKDGSVDIDHIINGEASFTHTTYTFDGWYRDSGFRQRISELSLALGNVTLYAKWTEGSESTTEQVYTRSGNYIYFGEYPQTIKASNVSITSNTPDADGYYLGSDGERYAKVVADPYPFNSGYTFSNNSSVIDGNTYYFKVEPIRWRILSERDGKAFILCDSIIASKAYDAGNNNNYANSGIRAWLNDEFYKTAFGELQQALIQTTEVDNSAQSTGNSPNSYACENTFDKVFLLSVSEVANSAYGFANDPSAYDTARRMLTSDFSRATGAYMLTSSSYYGNGEWWLRSPYYNYSDYARYVNSSGFAHYYNVYNDSYGVVPALNLTLS